jgi:hypothetical protein
LGAVRGHLGQGQCYQCQGHHVKNRFLHFYALTEWEHIALHLSVRPYVHLSVRLSVRTSRNLVNATPLKPDGRFCLNFQG